MEVIQPELVRGWTEQHQKTRCFLRPKKSLKEYIPLEMHESAYIQGKGPCLFFQGAKPSDTPLIQQTPGTHLKGLLAGLGLHHCALELPKDAGKSTGFRQTSSFELQCFISGYLFNSLQIPKACCRKQHSTIADRETNPKGDIIRPFYTFFYSFIVLAAILVSACSSRRAVREGRISSWEPACKFCGMMLDGGLL